MAIQGVNTEVSAMRTAANQALDTAQQLHAAVQQLNGNVHGSLGTWQGDASKAFWPGHEQHVSSTGRLVQSLQVMSDGIQSSGTQYEGSDQDNSAEQSQVASAGSGINLSALL